MSKKIKINISNKVKPNLSALFHSYLLRKSKESSVSDIDSNDYESLLAYWDAVFPGWDDDDDNDDSYSSKSLSSPYSGYEGMSDYESTDDFDDGSKEIWFYDDYNDKFSRIHFNSIKSFAEYCDEWGYSIPSDVYDDMVYRYESHCCLNPLSKSYGIMEVISEHSYGEMFYKVSDIDS